MIRFSKLKKEHMAMVLDWRIKDEVSQFMFTRIERDLKKQIDWFRAISTNSSVAYWIIEYQCKPIGLINLADIDLVSKKCNAGYYIGELEYRQISALILPYFYNYVFKDLGFNKIYGEVIDGNQNILKIHLMHGYRLVGTFKNHVLLDGLYRDVHIVELARSEWLCMPRYDRYKAEFKGDV